MRRLGPWALATLALACTREAPPPFGEAVVVVDADWPSTAELDRLRIDLFAEDGRWFDTRDVPDFSATRPISFGVFSDDETREKFTWIRLRAYPAGRLRDVPKAGVPRLFADGVDVTPATEPDRQLAVDRLLLVRLRPGERKQLAVTLHGECSGAEAILRDGDATRGPVTPRARSCFDAAPELRTVDESITTERRPVMADPRSWGIEPCPPSTEPSSRICTPGGPMILGATDLVIVRGEDPTPERLVLVSRFFMDPDEVTVGRYRAAIASGMAAPELPPSHNPGPLLPHSRNDTVVGCTWSNEAMGREEYPLNCIGRDAARGYCQFVGGDLPTEVQWEYAASTAGRARKSSYVWGEDVPECGRAVFGRESGGACAGLGEGPRAIAEYPDRTPLGVRGLAGGLVEWTLDEALAFSGPCWSRAPRRDPACIAEAGRAIVTRGGAWDAKPAYVRSTNRYRAAVDRRTSILGFRCVYREER